MYSVDGRRWTVDMVKTLNIPKYILKVTCCVIINYTNKLRDSLQRRASLVLS